MPTLTLIVAPHPGMLFQECHEDIYDRLAAPTPRTSQMIWTKRSP